MNAWTIMQETNAEGSVSAAIFDVCDTLFYSNTTSDFVDYFLAGRKSRFRKAANIFMTGRLSPFRYAGIAISVSTGVDLPRKIKIGLLKGFTRAELLESARKFVDEFLAPRKIVKVQSIIDDATGDGMQIVLCSSSIDPVVQAVSEKLGVQRFVCSELGYADGSCTGRLAKDLTGRKLAELRSLFPDMQIALAVSDNKSDLDLLQAADRGVAVVYGGPKEKFWRKHGIGSIEVKR